MWDAATGKELLTLDGPTFAIPASPWSRDGKLLAVVQNGRLLIADLVTGKKTPLPPGDPPKGTAPFSDVWWGPNGRELATQNRQGAIEVWDLTAGKPRLTIQGRVGAPFSWSPDGRWLAQASTADTT